MKVRKEYPWEIFVLISTETSGADDISIEIERSAIHFIYSSLAFIPLFD